MILEELIKEFKDMSDEETISIIMNIRQSRRVSKREVKKVEAKKVKNTTINLDFLSPEMAATLLQKLRGEK